MPKRFVSAAVLMMFLVLVSSFLTGCYQRVVLPTKSSPAVTKFFVSVTMDQGVLDMAEANSANVQGIGPEAKAQQRQMMAAMAPNLAASLHNELSKNNIGIPVTSADAADLILSGRIQMDPGGVAFAWQVINESSQRVVATGHVVDPFFTGNMDPFLDGVMTTLLATEVDVYASSAVGVNPTPAEPVNETLIRPEDPNAWALVIGIETYRDALPEASGATQDAKRFAEVATSALGVPEDQVKVLINERAGRADIASAVEEWLPRNAVTKGGRVYIFFSGHGAPDVESGAAYLVPYDADAAYLRTRGYAITELYENLKALKEQEVVIFFDACFSGAGDRSVLAEGTRPLVPVSEVPTPAGITTFAAAKNSQATGASADGQHGLFSYHLFAGLGGGADANGDSGVSAEELHAFISEKVTREARLSNREQNPTIETEEGVDLSELLIVNVEAKK